MPVRNLRTPTFVVTFMVSTLLADVRLALRTIKRQKTISALLVATLGLGLGANVAMFSVVDAMLLRPLDFPNLPRLVRVWETHPNAESFEQWNVSPANFLDWREQTTGLFESLMAVEFWEVNLRGAETPERAQGFKVSPEFFDSLGIRPTLGRAFLPGDGRPGEAPRVILGHGLWQRAFALDPGVVGRTVTIDGQGFSVVGVAPPGFNFPEGAEMWTPITDVASGVASREKHYLTAIGLLKPGTSVASARVQLATVARRLELENPATNKARGVRVEPLSRGFEDVGLRPVLGFFELGAGLVLLIACVSVANFLLARGAERRREVAVRQALGARGSRIMGQLLTEGLVTATLSLAVAFPVAAAATRAIRGIMPVEIARFLNGWSNIDLDGRAIAYGMVLAVLSSLVFSLAPARRVSRPELTDALKEGGRANTESGSRQRGRDLLVVVQIASALALVLVASLATRSAWTLIEGPQGYDPDQVLGLLTTLPERTYADPESRRVFAREAEARLRETPGAVAVAYANLLPAHNSNSGRPIRIEGGPALNHSELASADWRSVSSAYFETMRIPILSGRATDERDGSSATAQQVAVVSRSFAEKYWPGRDPLGQRFKAGDENGPTLTVVGVSGDVVHQWFARRNFPTYYRPYAQEPTEDIAFAVRTKGDPGPLVKEARRAVALVDPYLPTYSVWSMKHAIRMSTIGLRFVAGIMTALSALALLLALSGVYGVMAYRVSLRTLEIGVRLVLGATRRDILRLTMNQALRLTSAGLIIGGLLGIAGGRALSGVLQGAVLVDVSTVVGFSASLALAALLAAYIPALRSLAVDPARALRAE